MSTRNIQRNLCWPSLELVGIANQTVKKTNGPRAVILIMFAFKDEPAAMSWGILVVGTA